MKWEQVFKFLIILKTYYSVINVVVKKLINFYAFLIMCPHKWGKRKDHKNALHFKWPADIFKRKLSYVLQDHLHYY